MSDTPIANQPETISPAPITETQPATVAAPAPRLRGPSTTHIAIVVAVLGVAVVVTTMTSDVTKVSEPGVKVVDDKPVLVQQVGAWSGGEMSGLSKEEKEILPQDTGGARRLFKNPDDDQLYCSIILAGKDVTSIHKPEFCLVGQGWSLQNEGVESIPVPKAPGGALQVMRMNMVRDVEVQGGGKKPVRSVFVYWFVGHNRVTALHWQRMWWTSKDRILHNTNHRWAYILIHAPVSADLSSDGQGKSDKETMQLVAKFIQDMYPSLVVN